jgi:hypothetical protein
MTWISCSAIFVISHTSRRAVGRSWPVVILVLSYENRLPALWEPPPGPPNMPGGGGGRIGFGLVTMEVQPIRHAAGSR